MDELLKSAFVGTGSVAPPAPGDHPIDATLPDLSGDVERSVLLRSGARAVWQRAGYQPRRDVPAPEASPADACSELSERGTAILRLTINGDARELFPEFLEQMIAAGLRLPSELLPEVLSPAGRSNEIRQLIRKVIGERGRWLARLNPDWAWAANEQAEGSDREALERLWAEGSTSERAEVLRTLRESNAQEGREWLEAAFGNEKADVRARLTETLVTGLSIADEPFLEKTLGDRSEGVRTVAADLLARLSDSALVQRMTTRADAMLSATRSGMLKRTLKLECTPPQQIEKEWLRDGVPKDAPHVGFGPRATWTEAVIGAVPVSHWTTRFEASPTELVAAAKDDEFGDSVLAGWTRSAVRGREGAADWLPVLINHWFESLVASVGKSRKQADSIREYISRTQLQSAFTGLDRGTAEEFLRRHLQQNETKGEVALDLLHLLPSPWSIEFTRSWLKEVSQAFNANLKGSAYKWPQSVAVAVSSAPISCLDEIVAALEPIAMDPEKGLSGGMRRLLDFLRLRSDFHRELSEQTSRIHTRGLM